MNKDVKLLNLGAIVGVLLTALGNYLYTGDLPLWWWGYAAGAILIALANLYVARLNAKEGRNYE